MRPAVSTVVTLALVALGCAAAQAPSSAPPPVAARPSSGLSFSFSAPETAPYDPETLSASGRFVTLHVRNPSSAPLPLAGIDVSFTAERDGVAFGCPGQGPRAVADRLPATLAPGASVDVDREIGCTMPMPGRYWVKVFARTDDFGPRLVGTFELALVDGARVPRPLGVPGLFGLITGGKRTPPLTPKAWSEGDYHVVLVLINATRRVIRLGPAKLAFVVFKKGSPYPCTSEARPLDLPEQLAPGYVHTAQLPISCAPSEEGQYEVSGRISFEGGDEIEIGKLGLRVTRDPLLFAPLPLP